MDFYDVVEKTLIFFYVWVIVVFLLMIGLMFTFAFLQKDTCEKVGLDYNWNGKCIEYIGDKVVTYNVESIDWTGFNFKVNKVQSIPT